MHWESHPLTEEPILKSVTLCMLIIAFAVAVTISFNGIAYGLVTLIILSLSTSRYLLPTRYSLDENGVEIVHLLRCQRHPWTSFRRTASQRDGVFLSPFAASSRLDSFRGCFLRYGGNSDAVQAYVKNHVLDR